MNVRNVCASVARVCISVARCVPTMAWCLFALALVGICPEFGFAQTALPTEPYETDVDWATIAANYGGMLVAAIVAIMLVAIGIRGVLTLGAFLSGQVKARGR